MNLVVHILNIVGALGVFLYGMKIMSEGMQKAAGERLQSILNHITTNRFTAVFTGFLVTAIIQSSSATTVMVVSFVNAALLSLTQAIGIIMGANIGTTVTGWIVALLGFKFKISGMALPIIGLGLPLYFSKHSDRKDWGESMIGFGILFLGLSFLKDAMPRLTADSISFLAPYTDKGLFSLILFICAGALVTVIVHSSSASMAITLTMAHNGILPLSAAAAMVLGSNIGTTVDALLASIGTNVNARRAAFVHIFFNLGGVVVVASIFKPFLLLAQHLVEGSGTTNSLAMFHTLFNIFNTIIFIGFVPRIARLVERIISPKEAEPGLGRYRLDYMEPTIQSIPEINLLEARKEISRMARLVEEMFSIYLEVFNNPEKKMASQVRELHDMEDFSDQMQEEITQFLISCSGENLNETGRKNVSAMMRIVNELESVGDCCYNLILLAERRYKKQIPINEKNIKKLQPFTEQVQKFLCFITAHINKHMSKVELTEAYQMEEEIFHTRKTLARDVQKHLKKGANVKSELLHMDVVRQIEEIGGYCLNIAQALRGFY